MKWIFFLPLFLFTAAHAMQVEIPPHEDTSAPNTSNSETSATDKLFEDRCSIDQLITHCPSDILIQMYCSLDAIPRKKEILASLAHTFVDMPITPDSAEATEEGEEIHLRWFRDDQSFECDRPFIQAASHYTPLHYAALCNDVPMIEFWLSHGASINARTRAGHTPLHIALTHHHRDAAEALINAPGLEITDGDRTLLAQLTAAPEDPADNIELHEIAMAAPPTPAQALRPPTPLQPQGSWLSHLFS